MSKLSPPSLLGEEVSASVELTLKASNFPSLNGDRAVSYRFQEAIVVNDFIIKKRGLNPV